MDIIKYDANGNSYTTRNGLVLVHRIKEANGLVQIKKSTRVSELVAEENKEKGQKLSVPQSFQDSETSSYDSPKKKHKKKNKKKRKKDKELKQQAKERKKSIKKLNQQFDLEGRKINNGKLLAKVISTYYSLSVVNGRIYIYDPKLGKHTLSEKESVVTVINSWLEKNRDDAYKFTSRDTDEAYRCLLTDANIQRDAFSNSYNTPFVLCKNGVLDVETMKLLPFSPKYEFTSGINANYDESSVGKKFDEYIDFATDGDIEKKLLIQEILGYALGSYTHLRTAFYFKGQKGTGKSTLLEILRCLADEKATCEVSFHLMNQEYYVAQILSSKLNIVPDVPGITIKEISRFNSLVSDSDSVTGRNPCERPETKKCRTKMLFGSNHDLTFKGPSKEDIDAFFDRIIYVMFDRFIENRKQGHGETMLKEEADYIFTFAMQGLNRLITNNFKFMKCKSSERAKATAMAQYCPEEIFFSQCIKMVEEDIYESSDEIRQAFNAYCAENNVSGIYNIKSYLDKQGVHHYRKRIDDEGKICSCGNPISVYAGIRLRKKYRV